MDMTATTTATTTTTAHGIGAFAVVHLVELLIAFAASTLVLPALSRNHRKYQYQQASHSLFFSVVVSDWIFAVIGVIHHIALLGQGGHQHLTKSAGGVALDALFQLSFLATLLWPPILACYTLLNNNNRDTDSNGNNTSNSKTTTTRRPSLFVRVNWQLTWLLAGGYGALWTRALQRDRVAIYWTYLGYVLSAVLGLSVAMVLGIALVLYTRKAGRNKRVIQDEHLLKFLLLVTTLQLPLAVATWVRMSVQPYVLQEVAFGVVLLIPTLNAYNYGSQEVLQQMQDKQRSRTRTGGATHTSMTEDFLHTMDPTNIALEELDGLSEMSFLAEGAAGSVHKARWLGIDVAMKLIKLPDPGKHQNHQDLYQTIIQNSERAFLEEASICARLRHPNITLFIRAGRYQGQLGILTEFCQRGSLKDVLKKHFPLAWKRKIALAVHVAKGLTYLHARNPTYIHRDLKASNILVTDTWQAKLADFGISKVSNFVRGVGGGAGAGAGLDGTIQPSVRGYTETGVTTGDGEEGESFDPQMLTQRTMNESTSFAGTWRWNAPEILKDPTNCRYSRSTDMYSFGMVLWEILSDGAVPFKDVRFDFEVRERVISEMRPQIKPSPGCPEAFVALLSQCWSQHPSARPTASQAAAQLTLIQESLRGLKSQTSQQLRQLPVESIDSSDSDPTNSLFSSTTMSSVTTGLGMTDRSQGGFSRSTFGTRITNFFFRHGGQSHSNNGSHWRGNSSVASSSSRGFGSSRGGGFFFRSGGPQSSMYSEDDDDDDDGNNKFAILGSPSTVSSSSRSRSSSSSSSLSFHASLSSASGASAGGGGPGGGMTRRRGFSKESALPSLYEYADADGNGDSTTYSESSTAESHLDSGMSPIVELPMDAMLEDGGDHNHTFILDKPPTEEELEAAAAAYERDSERPGGYGSGGSMERARGFTFDSVKSGDSIVDASGAIASEEDELARTQRIKHRTTMRTPTAAAGGGVAKESLFV